MTTTTNEYARALQEAEQAEASAAEARRRMSEATRAADAERQSRRRDVWRAHLAEIDAHDYRGAIHRAKADVVAAVREEITLSPWAAVYRLMTAERVAAMDHAYANDLRERLGQPVRPVPPGGKSFSDPAQYLAAVVEAESIKTANDLQGRRHAEVVAAWEGSGQAPVRRLDPSRHRYYQDQVGRIAELIHQGELEQSQWVEITEGEDVNSRETQERSREGARTWLADLRRALIKARHDLANFEAGRIT